MIDKIILFFINLYFGGPQGTYQDENGIYDIDTHLMYEYFVDAPVEEKKVNNKEETIIPGPLNQTFVIKNPSVKKEKSFIVTAIVGRYANNQNFGEEWQLEMGLDFLSFTRENELFYTKKDPNHHFKLVKIHAYMCNCICTFSYVNTRNSMSHIIKPGDKIYRVN